MAKLSEMNRLIGNYLELHGDKDVTSIATCHGAEYKYIGWNPYTGAEKLRIPK